MRGELGYIKSYLEYLAEASRRIIKSYHFEHLFKPKFSRGRKKKCLLTGFYADENKLKEFLYNKNFVDCYEFQNKQNKDTILCSGLLIVNTNRKLFSGPLVYSKIKKDYEANEFYLSEIHVNYDILSTLVDIDEIDEDGASFEVQKLSRIINELETYLEKLIGDEEDKSLETGLEIMKDIEQKVLNKIEELLDLNPALKQEKIEIIENYYEYDYQKEVKKYKKSPRNSLKHKAIFQNEEDSSIFSRKGIVYLKSYHIVWLESATFSAYSSLKELLKNERLFSSDNISNGNFLTFLQVLLEDRNREYLSSKRKDVFINSSVIGDLNLEKLFKIFPIPLSNNQKIAIKNAFSSVISYIQGPPGTGKSHTITAIAILSLLTGKKVLVVSAKVPAIEVIKNKLEQIFNFEKDFGFLPYVFFHKDYKRAFINYIDKILNRPHQEVEEEIKDLEREIEFLINKINKKLHELERLERLKNEYYNTLHKLKKNSEEIISIHSRYIEIYNQDLKRVIKNEKISGKVLKGLREKLEVYRKLTSEYPEIKLTKLYEYKLIKTYEKYLPITKELIKNAEKVAILDDITDFCWNYLESGKLNKRIKEIPIEDINRRVQDTISELSKSLKNLVKIVVKLRINKACIENRDLFGNFKNLLRSRKHTRIKKYQDFEKIEKFLEIFPLFISEIRNIGEVLPLKEEIFDLVIVDEASQVNLPEIIPVFFRGKKLCVVGDDKQLSLESVGLNFSLSKKLDTFIWEKYKPAGLSYDEAKERRLTVASSSILDLLIENKLVNERVMLDEHFRSLPKLIEFNSKEFYEGRLIIMTDTPDKRNIECFIEIKVNGKRDKEKVIQEEVDKVVEIVKKLKNGELKINNPFLPKNDKLSIGIISIISKGVFRIKESLEEEGLINEEEGKIKVGTPEDLQGHEFDVVIFPLFLDENVKNVNHYENERRFNVATSRAKYLTILIRNEKLPKVIKRIAKYINYLGGSLEYPHEDISLCSFNPEKCESKLEAYVYGYLEQYIKNWKEKGKELIICNQYKFGPYRLDFVIFNKSNGKYVAIEVDGKHHFDGKDYAEWHKERIALLKRAGWNIINTPYYKWFYYGWLEEDNPILKKEVENIYKLCDKYLGLDNK